MTAPFRYWGAKVRMAPWLLERLPTHTHYVEGCAGSAAILAVKPPVPTETINDTYGEVLNFFRVLQDETRREALIDRVAFTPYAHAEWRLAGEIMGTPDTDPTARAWAFFVRMQMAVVPGRSGWSYSVDGLAGQKAQKTGRWATMPEHLRATAVRFERVQVTDWPVVELIDRLDAPGTLFLIDPPYLDESRPRSTGTSSGYADDAFDHAELLAAIHASSSASFAVTHYPHPLYDDSGLEIAGDFESHRNVPNGENRDAQTERLYVLDRGGARPDRLF